MVTLESDNAGIYSWDLSTNTVVADANMARFFDLPADIVLKGLPIERFLEKIHVEDRAVVARAIHDAIITGEPYRQPYRLVHEDGTIARVMAFGQCFRDEAGTPSLYTGMAFPIPEASAEFPADTLLYLCRIAQDYAEGAKNDPVRELLERAVVHLTTPEPISNSRYYGTRH
jgi:hypothetical protein